MKQDYTPWEAISTYLKNQSDKESEAIVKEWLHASPENIRIFNEILHTQSITGKKTEFYQPQKEILWKELMQRISVSKKIKTPKRQLWLGAIAVAAALIIAFFLGNWFSIMNEQSIYSTVIAPIGQRTQLVLPDQTTVWLNSGTELRYPANFSKSSRDVYFHGEAYFEVTKNTGKPFIVHAEKFSVKVFGTRFNVKENKTGGFSMVSLLEGKVQVLNAKNESLAYLEPGQQLKIKPDGIRLVEANNIESQIAWTNGMLVFDNQPFGEVIDYLENWYGVNINIDSSLRNSHKFTFNVKTESLREVLELISVITPINYSIQGEHVKIRKKN